MIYSLLNLSIFFKDEKKQQWKANTAISWRLNHRIEQKEIRFFTQTNSSQSCHVLFFRLKMYEKEKLIIDAVIPAKDLHVRTELKYKKL